MTKKKSFTHLSDEWMKKQELDVIEKMTKDVDSKIYPSSISISDWLNYLSQKSFYYRNLSMHFDSTFYSVETGTLAIIAIIVSISIAYFSYKNYPLMYYLILGGFILLFYLVNYYVFHTYFYRLIKRHARCSEAMDDIVEHILSGTLLNSKDIFYLYIDKMLKLVDDGYLPLRKFRPGEEEEFEKIKSHWAKKGKEIKSDIAEIKKQMKKIDK